LKSYSEALRLTESREDTQAKTTVPDDKLGGVLGRTILLSCGAKKMWYAFSAIRREGEIVVDGRVLEFPRKN